MTSKFIKASKYNALGKLLRAKPHVGGRMKLRPHVTCDYFDILDVANCASPDSVFNVGIPLCDMKKKKIRSVIFADRGVTFTGSQISTKAAFIQAVKDKCIAARGSRVYPIWDLQNLEENTGDPQTGSIGNLTTATFVTQDAVPNFKFGYDGTEARHKRMAAMNGMTLDVFLVDEGWTVYGTSDNAGGYKGFKVLQAYADVSKFPIADAVNQYAFRITLSDINEYRDNSLYVVTDAGMLSAVGLVNVPLKKVSNSTNVYKISIIADGGTNLEPGSGAAIAALTFTAINLQTGAAFTITSVADDTSLDVLTVTLDSTAYGLLATGDRIELRGPSASALAGANVKWYEFLPLVITK